MRPHSRAQLAGHLVVHYNVIRRNFIFCHQLPYQCRRKLKLRIGEIPVSIIGTERLFVFLVAANLDVNAVAVSTHAIIFAALGGGHLGVFRTARTPRIAVIYKSPEPERPHYVSYRSVLKNFELLNFLHDNNIHTFDAFQSVVDKAESRYTEVLNSKKKLEDKISETEKIIADFPRYKELVRKNPMTKAEREELKKLSYLADKGIYAPEHLQEKKLLLENLKSQLDNLDENIKAVKAERDKLTDYYDTYTQQMQNDSVFLLEKAREEQERMAQAVEIEENHEQERKYYYEK